MTRTYASIREALASGFRDPPSAGASGSSAAPSLRSSVTSESTTNSTSTTGAMGRSASAASVSHAFTYSPRRSSSYRPDTRRSSGSFDLARPSQASAEGTASNSSSGIFAIHEIQLSGSPPSEEEEVDLSAMTPADLDRLRAEDPFAYHSIPQVRRRSYRFERGASEDILREVQDDAFDAALQQDVGEAEEAAGAALAAPQAAPQAPPPGQMRRRRSSRASMPAGMLADAELAFAEWRFETSSVVSKRSRLSCEAHPSLVCDDLYAGGLMAGEGGEEDVEGLFFRLMAAEKGPMEE